MAGLRNELNQITSDIFEEFSDLQGDIVFTIKGGVEYDIATKRNTSTDTTLNIKGILLEGQLNPDNIPHTESQIIAKALDIGDVNLTNATMTYNGRNYSIVNHLTDGYITTLNVNKI